MMKSLKFILAISIATLCGVTSALACGPYYREPARELRMYKAVPTGSRDICAYYDFQNIQRDENCQLWAKLVAEAPQKDIEEVVYEASLSDLDAFPKGYLKDNEFAKKLFDKKNREHLDYLRFAKEVEIIRSAMTSQWYYPAPDDREHQTIDSLLRVSRNYKGSVHKSRYMLQEMRMLRTLGKYNDIIALWNNKGKYQPDNIIKRMMASYTGGAYLKLDRRDDAIDLYTYAGDIESLLILKVGEDDASGKRHPYPEIARLESIIRFNPDSKLLNEYLEELVRNIELVIPEYNFTKESIEKRSQRTPADDNDDDDYYYDPEWSVLYLKELEDGAIKYIAPLRSMCLNNAYRAGDPALLIYTAAYLDYLNGNIKSASNLLSRAEQMKSTKSTKDFIRAFRILLDACNADNSPAYMAKLQSDLMWLDQQLADNFEKDNHESFFGSWHYDNKMNYAFYYWQDVIRKVLLGEVVPRLVQSGDTTRALQFANYACNRIYEVDPAYTISGYDYEKGKWTETVSTMTEYRTKCPDRNYLDYSNEFFELAVQMSADQLAQYAESLTDDSDAFADFLNQHSYADHDYIYDIVGTAYLREMNYPEAVKWLSKVSPEYQARTNIAKCGFFELDPFMLQQRFHYIADNSNYRLRFAQEMAALEETIANETDPNNRAMARLRYATGLRNSFGRCWYLTQYGLGEGCYSGGSSNLRDTFEDNPYAQKAYEAVDRQYDTAFKEFTEPEFAALMSMIFNNYKTLMDNYGDTFAASLIRGRCDTYKDYNVQRL